MGTSKTKPLVQTDLGRFQVVERYRPSTNASRQGRTNACCISQKSSRSKQQPGILLFHRYCDWFRELYAWRDYSWRSRHFLWTEASVQPVRSRAGEETAH